MLFSLSAAPHRAQEGENGGFLLKHGGGNRPEGSNVEGPLTYADYCYREALLAGKKARDG